MWKRFINSTSVVFCVLLIAGALSAQDKVRTSPLSSSFTGVSGTPRLATENIRQLWVAAWRQPGATPVLLARLVGAGTGPSPFHELASGIAGVDHAFDFVFVRETHTFWLAYETPAGLRLQRLTQSLTPAGTAGLLDIAARQGRPHWVFDPARNHLALFWTASDGGSTTLRWSLFTPAGAVRLNKRFLLNAIPGSTLSLLDAKLNEKNGMMVCLVLRQNPASTDLLAVRVNAAGNLLPTVSLASYAGNQSLDGSLAFSSRGGQGFAIWAADARPLQYRLLNPDGSASVPSQELTGEKQTGANSVSAYFDVKNNRMIATWTRANEVRLAGFHPQTGAITFPPSNLAQSLSGSALHVQSSYQASESFAMSVWEEFDGTSYRVRSATFQMRTAPFVLVGQVQATKVYQPPVILDGVRYLMKYTVLSGGKTYRAYVTSETEFLGRKPQTRDWARIDFEPFRTRFRGYIEKATVIPAPQAGITGF